MPTRPFLKALLAALPALSFAADVAVPETPAGHALVAWLDAFNSAHLGDNYRRWDKATRESWTLAYVPGKRFIGKPVFLLISKKTFSAGEGFSSVLKDLKRATLIGETTGGGSGTIEFKPIDDHFTLVLPTGRSISPVTKTEFAGTGVEPDVKVAADQALDVALRLAAEKTSSP